MMKIFKTLIFTCFITGLAYLSPSIARAEIIRCYFPVDRSSAYPACEAQFRVDVPDGENCEWRNQNNPVYADATRIDIYTNQATCRANMGRYATANGKDGTSGTGTSGTGQPAGADGSGIVNPVVSGRTGSDAAAAESGSLFMMIISGILTFLMLLGAFLVLINLVQAAIDWISSGGDSSKVIKSRDRIIQSVIGILILSASYAIWRLVVGEFLGVNFVFSRLFP